MGSDIERLEIKVVSSVAHAVRHIIVPDLTPVQVEIILLSSASAQIPDKQACIQVCGRCSSEGGGAFVVRVLAV